MSKCHQCNHAEATIHIRAQEEDTAELLCWYCYNEILAKKLNVKLKDTPVSLSISDNEGELRHFNVEKELHPLGIRMEAAEDDECGYKFEVDDELDCDQHLLFERLVTKVKRGLETTYIKGGTFPNGQNYQMMRGDLLEAIREC